MKITVNFSSVSSARWYEYVSRFTFGGAMTAIAGIIAKEYGPGLGGLFLAFPAIFPASATLIESHEKRKKRQAGGHGTIRGRKNAGLDAAGATLGAFGLLAFALLSWKLLLHFSAWAALSIATAVWLTVSILAWKLWEMR